MKTLEQQLGNYGSYHRSKRNLLTHFFGIPLIVFAALCLLARVKLPIHSMAIDAAQIGVFLITVYYFMLSVSLGFIMGIILTLFLLAAQPIAAMAFTPWISVSIGIFVFGWMLQFIGHYYEGKKPAFVDDLTGLIIGPLYVTVEFLFLMGFYKALEDKVNTIAGQTKS